MALLRVGRLPEGALAAAAEFYGRVLPRLNPLGEGQNLLLAFSPADHSHRAWRLAAIQSLARDYAPGRVNGLASDSEPAIAAATEYLVAAPGVTGQMFELDDTGAGEVVLSQA